MAFWVDCLTSKERKKQALQVRDNYDYNHMTIVNLRDFAMEANVVSKSEFKAKALELFRQVESSGTSVIVTDHGKPVLEVRPYQSNERSPLQLLRDSVVRYDQPTEPVGADDWDAPR